MLDIERLLFNFVARAYSLWSVLVGVALVILDQEVYSPFPMLPPLWTGLRCHQTPPLNAISLLSSTPKNALKLKTPFPLPLPPQQHPSSRLPTSPQHPPSSLPRPST
jgi:hypothetical protein